MRSEKDPALPEIREERDQVVIRYGGSVLIQTKDQLTWQAAEAAEMASTAAELRQ